MKFRMRDRSQGSLSPFLIYWVCLKDLQQGVTGWRCVNTPDTQTSPEATFKATFASVPHHLCDHGNLINSGDKIQVTNQFPGFQSWWKLCRYMYTCRLNPQSYCTKLNHYTDKCTNTKHIHSTFQSNCKERRWERVLKSPTLCVTSKLLQEPPPLQIREKRGPLVEVWKRQHVGASYRASLTSNMWGGSPS